jgi:glutamate racemase
MGTQGTLSSLRFEKLLRSVLADAKPKTCEFVLQACKGLALAIEQQTEKSLEDTQALEDLCAQYVQCMGSFGLEPGQIDTLVLGCTHYVFVQDILRKLVGPDVNIISTGEAVAKQTKRLTAPTSSHTETTKVSNQIQLWTTGSLEALQLAASRWLDLPAHHCQLFQTPSAK